MPGSAQRLCGSKSQISADTKKKSANNDIGQTPANVKQKNKNPQTKTHHGFPDHSVRLRLFSIFIPSTMKAITIKTMIQKPEKALPTASRTVIQNKACKKVKNGQDIQRLF
jgi:hypothetical protein